METLFMRSKQVVTLAAALITSTSCSPERLDIGDTEERNGVVFARGSIDAFDGIVVTRHAGSSQVAIESRYRDGLLDGRRREWYEDGQLEREETFVRGVKDGVVREWSDDGQLVLERPLRGGKKDGLEREWFANGRQKSESTYEMGSLQGVRSLWYENGNKRLERSFVDGKAHGPTTEWYESGMLKSQATWRTGKPDGPYTEWYESGQRKIEAVYEAGRVTDIQMWDERDGRRETGDERRTPNPSADSGVAGRVPLPAPGSPLPV
jgi:antitoxin component YwqK of YwqJK toxin-antitoxin module